jgi:squalene-hopene/tetraprenyl-beta-curcumene cyclase
MDDATPVRLLDAHGLEASDRSELGPVVSSALPADPGPAVIANEGPAARRNDPLEQAIERSVGAIARHQHRDGFWCYEFEADCTIPAEYVLLAHFTGNDTFFSDFAAGFESRLGAYIRSRQSSIHDGWDLYPGGAFDISCSVKCYFALKLLGDDPSEGHMLRARQAILAYGGAARSNVFTRITLALFGQIPWRGVPVVTVELMLQPEWSPFHLNKVAYWSRTVTVPLSVLCSLKAAARNPTGADIAELFVTPAHQERDYFPVRSATNRIFITLDSMARALQEVLPGWLRASALRRANEWFVERLNGKHGLGAIFPAMINAHCALLALGYREDDPLCQESADAIKGLVVDRLGEAYCQPCVSPIWDTGLACLALSNVDDTLAAHSSKRVAERAPAHPVDAGADVDADMPADALRDLSVSDRVLYPEPLTGIDIAERVRLGLDWLASRQLVDEPGDWRARRPDLPGGGWPFEFGNDHYPDIDDTALVAWTMHRIDPMRYADEVARAAQWVVGMQSRNGGFGAFDVDNTAYYLNEIPFADHGALLDPPTADVTARCVAFLAAYDRSRYRSAIARALNFLEETQESEGSWYGRWGTNYVYGTWSVLTGLEAANYPRDSRAVERAVAWLNECQGADGGWGESNDSYIDPQLGMMEHATAFSTAWALLALMAAGHTGSDAVRRGVDFLLQTQNSRGTWWDDEFTCPCFPRVFYLKYHGYSHYFPLWALARFRREMS